ncbi:PLP-dependent aminotransferase family protein [Asaia siamensis]
MSLRQELTLELIGDPTRPVFIDLAESLIREIQRGRLKPGQILPGTRALSRTLGLHRNTVDAAYHELVMQGWLVSRASRGTFVAEDLPSAIRTDLAPLPPTGCHSRPTRRMESVLTITDGTPDPRLMPRVELARAFRAVMTSSQFLSRGSYADSQGALALREALAEEFLNARGLSVSADDILITHGSQMGLFPAASAILSPGDGIAVENPGYPFAWASFRSGGARVVGVPVDHEGLDVDYLAQIVKQDPGIRAVYVTPHHQYPTTVTLGAGRRLKLLELARRHDLLIIEDDYDHDYRFDSAPVLPLAARAGADQRLIHIGSLSKLTIPTLRLGYVIAPPDILERMTELREAIDRQGDVPLEQAMALMIRNGVLGRHARKARRVYAERRDFLLKAVRETLGDAVTFSVPAGGLAVWMKIDAHLDASAWMDSARKAGLQIDTGNRFFIEPKDDCNHLRFGFAHLDTDEIMQAVTILAQNKSGFG